MATRKKGARPVLASLSTDWYWEQDAELRFRRIDVQAGAAGEAELVRLNLGKRPWETGIAVEGGWDAHRALLASHAPFREVLMWRELEDGSRRFVSVSGEPVLDAKGRFTGYRGIGRDITVQKRREQLLRLQHAVTRRLGEARSSDEGVRAALQAICESEGWDCGELWRVEAQSDAMLRFSCWTRPEVDAAARFAEASADYRFHPGEGLMGLAWQEGKPLWIPDVLADGRALRTSLATQTGLRAALLCPIAAEGRVAGVLGFVCRRIRSPDAELLDTLAALGTQLALYLERADAEARFRRTFELAGVGVALIGLDRRFQQVNRRFCEILGYAEAELVGNTGRALSHPDDRDVMNAQRSRLYSGELDAARGEKRYLRKDGSTVWVAYTLALERGRAGEPLYEIAVYDDISARKAAEAALLESEARFRSLTHLSSDWFWEQDEELRFTRLEGRKVAGGDPRLREQLIGRRRWESGLEIEGGWPAHRALVEARRPFHEALMWRRMSDGSARYLSVSGEPIFGADGRFAGYRGVGRDVTDEKRAEQLLRLEHHVARALSEAEDAAAGLVAVIRAVCESESWSSGRYFQVDAHEGALVYRHGWAAPGSAFERLIGLSAGVAFAPGEGLPGLAWRTGEPVWSTDTRRDPRFAPKAPGFERVRGAFVFPVLAEGRTIGAITFSSAEVREPDERLLQTSRVIGSQVGQFVQRMRAEEDRRRFRLAMDSSGDMVLLVDRASMRYVDVNRTACNLLGYSRAELLALAPQELTGVPRAELERAYDALIAEPSEVGFLNGEYRCKDGSRLPFESSRRVLRAESGPIIVAIARDVRERLAAEAALRESEARFRALTEMSSDFFWDTDAEHRFTRVAHGPNYSEKIGRIVGRAGWDLPSTHPDQAGWDALRAAMDAHRPFRDFEFGRPWHGDKVRYFSVSGEPRFAADGAFLGYRGVGRDITDAVLARERIATLAYQDALTGLANRTSLGPTLEQAVERTRRRGSRLAGVFLDLDGFKEVNDAHGHDAGDRLLVEAARRLRGALRAGDPVARLGGDEFFVVLEDLPDLHPAERVAKKLLEALLAPYDLGGGKQARVSASIGISVFPDDAGDAATLVKHADTAMYAAKQAGKNAFRFYTAGPAANDARPAAERNVP